MFFRTKMGWLLTAKRKRLISESLIFEYPTQDIVVYHILKRWSSLRQHDSPGNRDDIKAIKDLFQTY